MPPQKAQEGGQPEKPKPFTFAAVPPEKQAQWDQDDKECGLTKAEVRGAFIGVFGLASYNKAKECMLEKGWQPEQ